MGRQGPFMGLWAAVCSALMIVITQIRILNKRKEKENALR